MKPYKAVIERTAGGRKIEIPTPFKGDAVTVQAVLYTNPSPHFRVHLYDADGDEFMYPIPGQIQQKIVTPEIPVTVRLPISFLDEDENAAHRLVIFGERHPVDPMEKSSFS